MASKKHLTFAELEQTPQFRKLTIKQQFWLRSYIESGLDGIWATQVVFECTALGSARAYSYEILQNKKIIAALNWYFRRTDSEILLNEVRADIAASRPGSPARAKLREIEAKLISKPKRRSR